MRTYARKVAICCATWGAQLFCDLERRSVIKSRRALRPRGLAEKSTQSLDRELQRFELGEAGIIGHQKNDYGCHDCAVGQVDYQWPHRQRSAGDGKDERPARACRHTLSTCRHMLPPTLH